MEAFCLTICRNLAIDRMKRMDNQVETLEEHQETADHSYASNPEEQTVQRDRIQLVRRLIDQLPEKQRTCMQLRDIEGKSYRDIATVMGITEQQVKVNIFRARTALKNKLKSIDNLIDIAP
jgi:RNA polymerase sigma-70 factor (ECF subfamily)